jgi:hypothetical protein
MPDPDGGDGGNPGDGGGADTGFPVYALTAEQLTELGLGGEAPGNYAVSDQDGTFYFDPVVPDETTTDVPNDFVEDPNAVSADLLSSTLTDTAVIAALMDGSYGDGPIGFQMPDPDGGDGGNPGDGGGDNGGGDTVTGSECDVYDLPAGLWGVPAAGAYALKFVGPDGDGKFSLQLQGVAPDNETTSVTDDFTPVGDPIDATVNTTDVYPVGPVNNPDGNYQIHYFNTGDFGATADGHYVLYPGTDGYIVMIQVANNGTAEDPNWGVIAPATPPASIGTVFIADPVDGGGVDTPPANPDYDKPLFEIVSVEEGSITGQEDLGGRFGAIETFGIRVIDNEDETADSFDLSNIDLSIEWSEGDYVYWGRYEAGLNTPTGETVPAAGETALVQKNFANDTLGVEDNVLEWAMIDAGETGVTYSEGDYLATFMLERRDTDIDSDITLGTSQYNFVDDAAEGENFAVPRSPNAKDFNFEYSEDAVNIQVANERGEAAPKLKLYVSDNTVTDGLSIVPVAQAGHFVKYEVVLNVSVPTFITGATIASAQAISIENGYIFEQSVIMKNGMYDAATEGAEAVGGVSTTISTMTYADEADTVGTAAAIDTSLMDAVRGVQAVSYTGDEFLVHAGAILDTEDGVVDYGDNVVLDQTFLNTVDNLVFEIDGLARPGSITSQAAGEAEGRYVVAEFVAYTHNMYDDVDGTVSPGITFSYGTMGDSDYTWSNDIGITMRYDHDGDANDFHASNGNDAASYWTEMVSDGSDVVVMGERYYSNPGDRVDAIGADDALGALRIALEAAVDVDGSVYTQAQTIAADFNQSGAVDSADAYDILRYSVFGEEDDGPIAKFVYVRDVETPTAGEEVMHSSVEYDDVIDLAITQDTDVNATAILIGDVTNSYLTLDPSPMDEYYHGLEDFLGLGNNDNTAATDNTIA